MMLQQLSRLLSTTNSRQQVAIVVAVVTLLVVSCTVVSMVVHNEGPGCQVSAEMTEDLTATNQSVPFLIIVAEARSGSTWLESFFKENENVLDFFEPLDARAFSSVMDASKLTEDEYTKIKLQILSNECQCQFDDVTYPSMGERASWSKSLHRLQGYLDKYGEVLPPYRKSGGTELKATLKAATPKDLGAVEIMCRTMDMISAKVIRLTDLSMLSKLPEMGCRNYKILHLVRDPRPIVQSRISTFGELHTGNSEKSAKFSENDITAVAAEMCATYLHNLKVGLSEEFNHRYRVIKYEDIATAPIEYAKLLYKFTGLELTKSVQDYIIASSTGAVVQGKYEVVRNTAEVVDNWKNVMDPVHAKLVEFQCQKMFKTFGYKNL